MPLILAYYLGNRLYWLYGYCYGGNMLARVGVLLANLQLILRYPIPSFYIDDMVAGLISAAILEGIIMYRKTNAKKYRHGVEYGSARWGSLKDILPFMDAKDERNNMILTQTEGIRIKGRPQHPKYDRNKNVCVVGGNDIIGLSQVTSRTEKATAA